jgi:hypothetical protein
VPTTKSQSTTTPTTTTTLQTTTKLRPTTPSPARYAVKAYGYLRQLENKESRKEALRDLPILLPGLAKNMSQEIHEIRDPRMRKTAAEHFKDVRLKLTFFCCKLKDEWDDAYPHIMNYFQEPQRISIIGFAENTLSVIAVLS